MQLVMFDTDLGLPIAFSQQLQVDMPIAGPPGLPTTPAAWQQLSVTAFTNSSNIELRIYMFQGVAAGIDTIEFTQIDVPEPQKLLLTGSAFLVMALFRCFRGNVVRERKW